MYRTPILKVLGGPFKVIKFIFFSVLQEGTKRILKQKSHSYEG